MPVIAAAVHRAGPRPGRASGRGRTVTVSGAGPGVSGGGKVEFELRTDDIQLNVFAD